MLRTSVLSLFFLFCLSSFAEASGPTALAEPCCEIVSIDRASGVVTAKILKTGKTFKFQVDSRSLLTGMRVGQKLWVDAATRKVSVIDGVPCCGIVGPADLSSIVLPETNDAQPCCAIIGVDKLKGLVTARDPRNARTFQFRATSQELASLNVGDPVNADLTRGSLTSLKGVTKTSVVFEPERAVPCCDIVNVQPDPGAPCCEIVNAKNNLTGEVFQFRVEGAGLRNSLRVGQSINLDSSGGYAFVQSSSTAGIQGSKATFSFPVTAASASAAADSNGRTDPGRTLVTSPVRWEMKPSADLKGKLGQIVVQFPGMTSSGNNSVAVFDVGGTRRISDATYGNKSFPLLDGEYDVEVNSVRISRVPVKRGMDTRIHGGTIRFDVPSNTSVEVYDKTEKTRLCLSYGSMLCGAPSGEYVVKVGGSSRKVTIADGQVIDF